MVQEEQETSRGVPRNWAHRGQHSARLMMRMVTCERVSDENNICLWHVLLTDQAVVGWREGWWREGCVLLINVAEHTMWKILCKRIVFAVTWVWHSVFFFCDVASVDFSNL